MVVCKTVGELVEELSKLDAKLPVRAGDGDGATIIVAQNVFGPIRVIVDDPAYWEDDPEQPGKARRFH